MTAPIPPVVPPGHMSSAPQPGLPLPCGALLRPWTPPDAPALAEATHDPDIAHWNRNPRLDPAAAGERIARWAARWAFEGLGLHRVRITHSVRNPASCAVALRAGFPLEGTMRGALLHSDGWHDEHLHARLRTD